MLAHKDLLGCFVNEIEKKKYTRKCIISARLKLVNTHNWEEDGRGKSLTNFTEHAYLLLKFAAFLIFMILKNSRLNTTETSNYILGISL